MASLPPHPWPRCQQGSAPSTLWLTSYFNPNLLRQSFVSTAQSLFSGFNFLLVTERKCSRQSNVLMLGSFEYRTWVTRTLENMKQQEVYQHAHKSNALETESRQRCSCNLSNSTYTEDFKTFPNHKNALDLKDD